MQRSRDEVRMLCADLVEVWWKDSSGRKLKAVALLEDISRSGMCLQFEIPVAVGSQLVIHCRGENMAGAVRYCVYREIGYFVGIELEETTLWSRKQFEPEHLLDLQEMVLRQAETTGGYIQ